MAHWRVPPNPSLAYVRKPRVYVASPLGFSDAGRDFYRRTFLPCIRGAGLDVIDPWTLTDPYKIERVKSTSYGKQRKKKWGKLNIEMARNNHQGIRASDVLVTCLDGTDVDSGTAAEIGYAAALNIPVFGYRGDFRLSGDNEGCIVNLQVEYFIRLNGGQIVTTIKDLFDVLYEWRKVFDARTMSIH